MLKVLSYILCDLDPKVKVIGQKAGICDGVPSTSALVFVMLSCASVYWYIVVTCWERAYLLANCEVVTYSLVSWVRCGV